MATDPPAGLVEFFTLDHHTCGAAWALVQAVAAQRERAATRSAFAAFEAAFQRHLAMEDDVLFAALEDVLGPGFGPTHMMRMEHRHMREILGQMRRVAATDPAALVQLGETLWDILGRHSLEEEGVLYPLAALRLAEQWPDLARRLAAY